MDQRQHSSHARDRRRLLAGVLGLLVAAALVALIWIGPGFWTSILDVPAQACIDQEPAHALPVCGEGAPDLSSPAKGALAPPLEGAKDGGMPPARP